MAKLALDSGRHAYSERADDLYETPPAAVLALLGAESLPRRIWERAAGRGAIVEVVRSTGHDVVASDLRDRGDHRCPGTTTGIESFNTLVAPDGDCILTNPPFRKSGPQPFVSHGLKLCRCVIILARLTFIESKRPILESGTCVRAMPFKSRLPMMDRDHANRTLVISLEGSGTFSDFRAGSDKSGSSVSLNLIGNLELSEWQLLPYPHVPRTPPSSRGQDHSQLHRHTCEEPDAICTVRLPQKHPNAECARRARRDGMAPQEASNA